MSQNGRDIIAMQLALNSYITLMFKFIPLKVKPKTLTFTIEKEL